MINFSHNLTLFFRQFDRKKFKNITSVPYLSQAIASPLFRNFFDVQKLALECCRGKKRVEANLKLFSSNASFDTTFSNRENIIFEVRFKHGCQMVHFQAGLPDGSFSSRVARWFIFKQGCQMVYFHLKNLDLVVFWSVLNEKCWYILRPFGNG
jgi:hypothetical protein